MENNLQPYQQRVVDEKEAIDKKRADLSVFIEGPMFSTVHPFEQDRLRSQLGIMKEYSYILGLRISSYLN